MYESVGGVSLNFIKDHKKLVIIGIVVFVLVFLISGVISSRKVDKAEEERLAEVDKALEELNGSDVGDSDNELLNAQKDLIAEYGVLPKGFIWDYDGTLLSLGDKEMTAEEVVYAYFRGLSTLDISTVERYTRGSKVVETYSSYFDSKDKNTDYTDQFLRNIYRECLLSIQIKGISSASIFANKQSFTVDALMLDLTDKNFWKSDESEIYNNLFLYDQDESDNAKSDMYLYDYILNYYKSDKSKLRKVTFDVTVQRYPDLDSGFLVSIDTDVDNACQYREGKLVVSYIKEQYNDVGRERIQESKKKGTAN